LHNLAHWVTVPYFVATTLWTEPMCTNREPDPPVSDHSFLAAGLFARLSSALDRNDFAEAESARDRLCKLGYIVQVRIPDVALDAPRLRQEGASREVSR
jgi:hypothetical protein